MVYGQSACAASPDKYLFIKDEWDPTAKSAMESKALLVRFKEQAQELRALNQRRGLIPVSRGLVDLLVDERRGMLGTTDDGGR